MSKQLRLAPVAHRLALTKHAESGTEARRILHLLSEAHSTVHPEVGPSTE